MSARYIVGDTRDVTASLPDGSIDLVLTSPPFLALRSYLPDDHPDKHREIGSEATPADFIDVLLDLSEEWARVLAPHGTIVVELGDTYAGSGGAGGDYAAGGMRDGQGKFDGSARRSKPRNDGGRYPAGFQRHDGKSGPQTDDKPGYESRPVKGRDGWPLDKSLCGIPWLYTLSLAYGRNLLRPERTTDPWRVRNVVAWCRPNPPVGALGDKVRPATSYMTMACKSRTRWFDLDAVRSTDQVASPRNYYGSAEKGIDNQTKSTDRGTHRMIAGNPAGAPPLDHWWHDDVFEQDAWLVSTEPYKGSHYATWPRDLLTRPIEAMCPLRVCTVCGEPSRRIVERSPEYAAAREAIGDFNQRAGGAGVSGSRSTLSKAAGRDITSAENITVGWSDCGHNAWRNGVVLDPFAGSGTTLAVATGHGRDAIGIDIDARNADLALERVGPMFLTVEHHRREEVA